MASQISPGIILKERDITTATIVGAQALTGALATTFTKGPVDRITSISSQREFIDTFGLPVEQNAEDWFVASEFLNYGGRLAVVRALTEGLRTSSSSGAADFIVKTELDWLGNNYAELFAARTPGKWGNSVQVVVVDRGADQYIELASAPVNVDTTPGTLWSFSNGNTGYVLSWDPLEFKAAIVLNDPQNLLDATDKLNDGDTIRTLPTDGITTNVTTQTARTPGIYNYTEPTNGAELTITVANGSDGSFAVAAPLAGRSGGDTDITLADGVYTDVASTSNGGGTLATFNVTRDSSGAVITVAVNDAGSGYAVGDIVTIAAADIGGGATTDLEIVVQVGDLAVLGGAVTIDLTDGGDGYSVGDTFVIPAASIGGGSNVTVTVSAVSSTSTTDIAISTAYDWYNNTSISVGELQVPLNSLGVRPGTSQFAADRGISYDELTIAVIDVDGKVSGTVANVVERINSLSKLSDGRSTENGIVYYKTVINDQSKYIFTGTNNVTTVINSTDGPFVSWNETTDEIIEGGAGTKFAICGVASYTLSAGADDYIYNAAEIVDAYELFSSSDETELDFLLMGGSMGQEDDTKSKASKLVQIASARKDCIAFISPHKGNQIGTGGVSLSAAQQKEKTINFFRNLTSTSYAIFDSGYKYLYDRFNDRYRYIPCNGDVAGLCVSTSAQLADWYSPAGVARGSLRNAIKLAYNPSAADRDDLYTNRINPITTLPGTGITLFGDKTALASTSAFDRINVRRLFLNIERRVKKLASGVLFEQNDVLTRSSFSSAVNSYLAEVQAKRGVTDFLVVCDESNNTPDVIDRNEFVAEIFIKAARSINFVNITFTATKTGVSFSEVVGR